MSPSHAQFQSIVENITDRVMIMEIDGTIRYVNPALRTMLGYAPEELVGSRILEEGVPYLQKPFTAAALAAKVREVLDP